PVRQRRLRAERTRIRAFARLPPCRDRGALATRPRWPAAATAAYGATADGYTPSGARHCPTVRRNASGRLAEPRRSRSAWRRSSDRSGVTHPCGYTTVGFRACANDIGVLHGTAAREAGKLPRTRPTP